MSETNTFVRIARNDVAMVIFVGLLAFAASAVLSLSFGVPVPHFSDEYSYILAAETFSKGRVTNPTHTMWEHFASMHVLHKPTYMSRYPPAQGLILALGKIIGGHPIVGVWLGMALMCGGLTWMLQAWLPRKWAFFGGLLSILHIFLGVSSYWAQSYMGGAVAAFGGALLFGALRRIIDKPNAKNAVIFALGLVILANSRPWEGLVTSIPAVILICWWILSKRLQPTFRAAFKTIILPMLVVLSVGAVALGYYNLRVTGNPFLLPYIAYAKTHPDFSTFFWQKPDTDAEYSDKKTGEFSKNTNISTYSYLHTFKGFMESAWLKIKIFLKFFNGKSLGLLVLIPLFLFFRDGWIRFAYLTVIAFLATLMLQSWFNTYSTGPLVAPVFFLMAEGLRILSGIRINRVSAGKYLVILVFVVTTGFLVDKLRVMPTHRFFIQHRTIMQVNAITRELKRRGGRHLIMVRYSENYIPAGEWIHNEPDIDNSVIVMAREKDKESNYRLFEYFRGRHIWLLEIESEENPAKFTSYPISFN